MAHTGRHGATIERASLLSKIRRLNKKYEEHSGSGYPGDAHEEYVDELIEFIKGRVKRVKKKKGGMF